MQTLFLVECLCLSPLGGLLVDPGPVEKALGSIRFAERQRAAVGLQKAWPYSAGVLSRASESRDAEVAERARAIVQRCRYQDLESAGLPPFADWPLWCMRSGTWQADKCRELSKAVQRELQTCGCSRFVGEYPGYRAVSEVWGWQALQKNVPPSLVRLWFQVGRNVDQEYHRKQQGYEWNRMPAGK